LKVLFVKAEKSIYKVFIKILKNRYLIYK